MDMVALYSVDSSLLQSESPTDCVTSAHPAERPFWYDSLIKTH